MQLRRTDGSDGIDEGGRLTWQRLLVGASASAAVAMGLAALLLGDLEALAVGIAFAVAAVLLRTRLRPAGRTLAVVVAAVTSFFMSAAAVTNASSGASVRAVMVPSLLASIALVTLAAAVLASPARMGGRGPAASLLGAGILVVGLTASGLFGGGDGGDAHDLALVAEGLAFSETALVTGAGEVTVAVTNEDLFWHTFTIPELGVDLPVPVGATRRVTFAAGAGSYEFICRIPGHPEAGMVGTLTLET